ncbi:LysR family transcriptional regulator [Methylosinus sporium]|uniref:LysR substrate-binding domain-containing protein n=1 Tax=Methylosinus sporium TaxID=428 RepID=UPI000D58EC79|nr:LysR family transcriptional regulator [Methylosinus sporium]PWB88703.1 LysR family transcriptional regulator [Methylocystis sp. MitZ-2018]
MNSELRDLKWALVASRHRSLRQAAETLNTRQSTLSRRLHDLECELGVDLFERTTGGTKLTPVGREFLDLVRPLVDEADRLFLTFKTRRNGGSRPLRIGICSSLSAGNLRETLAELRRQIADADILLVDGAKEGLLGELAAGAIDVAILTSGGGRWNDRVLPLWGERVVVAVPEHHPLHDRQAIKWRELCDNRILLTRSGVDSELEQLLSAKAGGSVSLRISYQDVSLDRLLSLVGAGYGVSPLLEGAAGFGCPGVTHRELHDDCGQMRLQFAAYWKETNSSPMLQPFLDLLRARYPDLSVSATSG